MADPRMPFRRSPLFHRRPLEAEGGAVRIQERPFLGKFILRMEPKALLVDKLRTALGLDLPLDPLSSAAAGETSFLWLGPDEWMLVTSQARARERADTVHSALAGNHYQLADVSDYYTLIELAGPQARPLLMKLTTLDVHPRAFRSGMAAGSMFGRSHAVLWLPQASGSEEAFHLFVRWSMADYLWCLIADAGREWGVPEEAPVKGERLTIA